MEAFTADTRVVATKDHLVADVSGESVILHLADGIYYGLEAVGTRIWTLLQTPRTVATIRDAIVAEFDVSAEQCEADLVRLLEELREHRLIEVLS